MVMKRFMALEEHLEGADLTVELQAEISNAQLEVQQGLSETDQQFDVIDEANNTKQVLGSIAALADETLPDGGLSEPVAAALTAAVEHFVKRMGSRRKLIPALESFKPQSRARSTRLALEGIKEFAKGVWEAIVKAFQTAYEWIKRVFSSLFSFREALKKKAKVVQASEDKVKKEYSSSEFDQAAKSFMASSSASQANHEASMAQHQSDMAQFDKRSKEHDDRMSQHNKDHDEAMVKNKASLEKIKRQKAALDEAMEELARKFIGDKTLVNYFRKNKTECYTANEINARFLAGADTLSPFLTHSQGNTLPEVCKKLAEKTAELSTWDGDPANMKFSEINDHFANVLTYAMCQGETLDLKGGEASMYADTTLYNAVRVNMVFDEDLVLTILRNPLKATVEQILVQNGVFVKRPALENLEARLELISPNTGSRVIGVAENMLSNDLKSHIEDTTSALDALLKQGEETKKKIDAFTNDEEREASLKRLQTLLMLASSSTVRILATCQKAEAYESKMIATVLDYSHKSTMVLEAFCNANKNS